MTSRNQAQDAQQLYDLRADKYDESWHPRFASHIVELAKPQPGEHVLDLAAGTGLVSFLASTAVGPSGSVTAVDISGGILEQARLKQKSHAVDNVIFHQHSITDLASLAAVKDKQFEVINCASALVLLPDPGLAIKDWTKYLKPGGRLITDATHPANQISSIAFERVGQRLGRPLPFYRLRFQEAEDLEALLKVAGLTDVETVAMSQIAPDHGNESDGLRAFKTSKEHPRIQNVYTMGDADDIFDKYIVHWAAQTLSHDDVKEEARKLFKEEFAKLADDGWRIVEVDCVFVGIGRKPV